ncbi:MAG: hypothetical protein AAFP99_11895, partial [Pseudomonadota bacterium]
MTATAQSGPPDDVLPKLRQSLQIVPCAETGVSGEARWMIFDPVRHTYVRLTDRLFDIFSVWHAGSARAVIRMLAMKRKVVSLSDVEAAAKFARESQLTVEPEQGGWRAFAGVAEKNRKSPFMQAAHTYVFFRVPLFAPEPMLKVVWPLVSWMFTRWFVLATAVMGLFSLFLVQRQWDVFIASFSAFMTLDGFLAYALALVVLKVLHEFGHALGLRHQGDYNYNGTPITYQDGAYFSNDSWQLSVMSYF